MNGRGNFEVILFCLYCVNIVILILYTYLGGNQKMKRRNDNFEKVWEDKDSMREIAKIVLAMGTISMTALSVVVATILTTQELTYQYLLKVGMISAAIWVTLFFVLSIIFKLNEK